MTKISLKSATGAVIGMMTLAEDSRNTGSLDQLQRVVSSDMRGLVVTWATAEEIRAFELSRA